MPGPCPYSPLTDLSAAMPHSTLNLSRPNSANHLFPHPLTHPSTEFPIFIKGAILHPRAQVGNLAPLHYVQLLSCQSCGPKLSGTCFFSALTAMQTQHFLLGPTSESLKSSLLRPLFPHIHAIGVNFPDITNAVLLYFVMWRTKATPFKRAFKALCPLAPAPRPSLLSTRPSSSLI